MPDSSSNNSQGRWCHSSISKRNCLALPSRYAEYDTLSHFAKKEVMDHWPEPDPPLLLVLEPASDAPVAAVPADPAQQLGTVSASVSIGMIRNCNIAGLVL